MAPVSAKAGRLIAQSRGNFIQVMSRMKRAKRCLEARFGKRPHPPGRRHHAAGMAR